MANDKQIIELLQRAKDGDADAAIELIRNLEKDVCRVISIRLNGSPLRRLFATMDFVNSVFGTFFDCLRESKYSELASRKDVIRLLVTMALNRLRDQYRKIKKKPEVSQDVTELQPACKSDIDPARVVEEKETSENEKVKMDEFSDSLSPDVKQVLALRLNGMAWEEIGNTVGAKPNTLRMRLNRAIKRFANSMNGKEEGNG